MTTNTHDFTLVLRSDMADDLTPALMDALAAAGCEDATPSLRNGRVYLAFSRPATSFSHAVSGAIQDLALGCLSSALFVDLTDAEKLAAIEAVIRDYHLALDEQQHGGVAQAKAFGRIEDIMGLHWR